MKIKKWSWGIAAFLAALLVVGVVQQLVWQNFRPQPIKLTTTVQNRQQALSKLQQQLGSYYQSWRVPYGYRIGRGFEVKTMTNGKEQVQLKYHFYPAIFNLKIIHNFGGIAAGNHSIKTTNNYLLQQTSSRGWKLQNQTGKGLVQTAKIKSNIKQRHHLPPKQLMTSNMNYSVQNNKLYITYEGHHQRLVPDGYQRVFLMPDDTYNEHLNAGSYLITPNLTAFVSYSKEKTGLLYSFNQGKNWHFSGFKFAGFRGNAFISQTNSALYVTYASDQSLGSSYYLTLKTTDLRHWRQVNLPELEQQNLTLASWQTDRLVYYASQSQGLKFSTDGGKTFKLGQLNYPTKISQISGGNPFTVPQALERRQGKYYLFVGQSEAGDYVRNGKLQQAELMEIAPGVFDFKRELASN